MSVPATQNRSANAVLDKLDATGAVQRSQASINAESVRLSAFGAYGNRDSSISPGIDDSIAIQAAIDDLQEKTSSGRRAKALVVSAGEYSLRTPIVLKGCDLIGESSANRGVRFYWDGDAGATVFTKPPGSGTGPSIGLIDGIDFRDGANQPATFFDFTDDDIDAQFQFNRVSWSGCSGDAIKLRGWVNLHWRNLRWDRVGGYAIRATPQSTQSLSSFVIDQFTYDHSISSSASEGFVFFDNSANASNLGVACFRDARIEVNQPWAGAQAIVRIKVPNSGANSRSLALLLQDIAYQGTASMASDCILYRDTSNTTGSEFLMLLNVRQSGLNALRGGTWPATNPTPPLQTTYPYFAMNTNAQHVNYSGWSVRVAGSGGSYPHDIFLGSGTSPRYRQKDTGEMEWGSGSTTPDTNLRRVSADVLGTDDDLAIATAGKGLKVAEGSNAKMGLATLSGGTIVVSTTAVSNSSRIFLTKQSGSSSGSVRVSARSSGTSFTITSADAADTATVAWMIVEPA